MTKKAKKPKTRRKPNKELETPREIRLKDSRYQPSKAELEADVSIDTTAHKLALAVLRPVRIIEDTEA